MAYIQFNPAKEFENLTKEFNQILKNVTAPENMPRISFQKFNPRVDILEDAANVYFEIELAGVPKDRVSVTVNDDNIITIKGSKEFERKDEVKVCCKSERAYGDFTRSFQLPDSTDNSKIEAKYENGILFLTIPKIEPVKPKEQTITIN